VIHACYKNAAPNQGQLRVIDTERGQQCSNAERPLFWYQRGPTGARGAAGATGARGPSGPRGATGPAGSGATSFTATLPNEEPPVDHTLLTLDNGIAIKGQCEGNPDVPFADVQLTLASASNELQVSGTYNEGTVVFPVNADASSSRLDAFGTIVDFDVVARGTSVGSFAHIDLRGIASNPSCRFWGMIIPSQLTGP
jgi:hypothetical protein